MYVYLHELIEFNLKETNFTQICQRYSVPIKIAKITLKLTNFIWNNWNNLKEFHR